MRQIIASDPQAGVSVTVEYSGRIAVRVRYCHGTKETPPIYISRQEMLDLMRVQEAPRPARRRPRNFPNAAVSA